MILSQMYKTYKEVNPLDDSYYPTFPFRWLYIHDTPSLRGLVDPAGRESANLMKTLAEGGYLCFNGKVTYFLTERGFNIGKEINIPSINNKHKSPYETVKSILIKIVHSGWTKTIVGGIFVLYFWHYFSPS